MKERKVKTSERNPKPGKRREEKEEMETIHRPDRILYQFLAERNQSHLVAYEVLGRHERTWLLGGAASPELGILGGDNM